MDMSAITNMLSGAGNFIQKNPEKFAIAADMVGSNLAPDNPFAGVGQAFGQSSLVNKARTAQQKQLSDLLAGRGDSATSLGGTPPKQPGEGLSLLGGMDLSMFTDASQAGPTSMTIKAQPDGSQVATTNHTVQTPHNVPNATGVNLTDVVPFSNALAGGQQDLTGLDPALIANIMGKDLGVANLKAATAHDLQTGALAAYQQQVKQQALDQKQQVDNSLISLRGAQAKKTELETRLAEENAPDKKEKLQAELSKINLGLDETTADIQTKTLANKAEADRQQLIEALSGDVTPADLSTQGKLGLYGPSGAANLETSANTSERLKQEATAKAKAKATNSAYKALASLNSTDATVESNTAAIEQWNTNSPDEASFGYFTGTEDPWGPGNDERGKNIKVDLPTGMNMGWIRKQAKEQGVAVDKILQQLRDEMRGN